MPDQRQANLEVAIAIRVKEYLAQNPQKTYTAAGNRFGVTRARVSQLMTILEKLPDDFLEKMGECKDQNLIKRFSGKTLDACNDICS